MNIKLKVYTDGNGDQWIAIGLSIVLDPKRMPIMLLHDDEPARIIAISIKEWTDLPQYYFIQDSLAPVEEVPA